MKLSLSSRPSLTLLSLTVLVGSGIAARPASAQTTIGFDDLASEYPGSIPNGYFGLDWNNFHVLDSVAYEAYYGPTGYSNGLVSPDNVAYNGNYDGNSDPYSITSATSFIFNSGYFTAAWNDGLNISVTGLSNGTTLYTKTFSVDTTGPTLETFNWAGVDEVDFVSSGGVHHDGYYGRSEQFALDNLTINAPVPEASTTVSFGLLLALGLGGVMFTARRKNRMA